MLRGYLNASDPVNSTYTAIPTKYFTSHAFWLLSLTISRCVKHSTIDTITQMDVLVFRCIKIIEALESSMTFPVKSQNVLSKKVYYRTEASSHQTMPISFQELFETLQQLFHGRPALDGRHRTIDAYPGRHRDFLAPRHMHLASMPS